MIIIEAKAVGPFFKNGFVVACARTREGVLIDPGDEVDALLDFAARNRISVGQILLTHAHVDHVTGVGTARQRLKAPIYLHRDDLFLYERAVEQALMFGLRMDGPLPAVDRFYSPEETIAFGDYGARAHHTPGHCPGGVCLEVRGLENEPPHLFVGDTLFAGSIGRTDLPGGDYDTLISSIRRVLFGFGDAAKVYPGHGPATTIGKERETNPFLSDL